MLANSSPEEVAVEGPRGMMVISGGSGLRELADAGSEERAELIRKLQDYFSTFDYVLIDTSPGIGSNVMDFIEVADDVLLVTTPEPTSIRDSYAALKTIVAKIPNASITPVVTSAVEISARQAVSALNHVTRKFLDREWTLWQMVDSDPLVGRTIQARKLLVSMYPKSPAAIALCRIAKFLMARKEAAGKVDPRGGNGFVLGKV
jgi:flagellar biosynthesis protein FlhG